MSENKPQGSRCKRQISKSISRGRHDIELLPVLLAGTYSLPAATDWSKYWASKSAAWLSSLPVPLEGILVGIGPAPLMTVVALGLA